MIVIALDYAKLEENSQIEMIMPTPRFSIKGNIISVLMRVCHAGSRAMTKQDELIAMTSHDRRGVSNHRQLNFCSTCYAGWYQIKYESVAFLCLLFFCGGIHRWSVIPPHKGSVIRQVCPSDDDITYMPGCHEACGVSHLSDVNWPC